MRTNFDVIIVGLGIMGTSAAYHLARRGVRVLGLDQFSIPNNMGSSHGDSRAIRKSYFEHPDYVPLLQRSYELWRELEAESSQKLLYITGGLYLGTAASELVSGSLLAAQKFNLPHESLGLSELSRRFSQFQLPDNFCGMYEEDAGLLRPELAVSTNSRLAMGHGAELHGHEAVDGWASGHDGVTVTTAKATYSAEKIVFCAGPWSSSLMADLGAPLVVTRQVVGWVWPNEPQRFELGQFPTWALALPDETIYYGLPMLPERPGMKIAHHVKGKPVHPDNLDRTAMPSDELDFRPALSQFIPPANGPLMGMSVCLYTNSPDSHFILDTHPEHKNVIVACGFSGHGFKFATVVGEALADLSEFGKSDLPIGFLGLDRFT